MSQFFNRSTLRASFIHFGISLFVGVALAAAVFGFWFPHPYQHLAGGLQVFAILVGVDVVCGPLLTLVVYKATKPRRELIVDLMVIALLQCAALGYGIHTLSLARPIALVYEVDRFRVVSIADVQPSDAASLPTWVSRYGFHGPRLQGLRMSLSGAELAESLDLSTQGIEPSQRPSRWQDYALSQAQVAERAHPVAKLKAMHPARVHDIEAAIKKWQLAPDDTRWLPVVGRLADNWIVLLAPNTMAPVGFLHLSGL